MGKCYSLDKKEKNGAITKANKKSSKIQDSSENENHNQDKSSIAVVIAEGNARVSLTRKGTANTTIRTGSEKTNVVLYSSKDDATINISEAENSKILVEVDVNGKAPLKNADVEKEVNERNDSNEANQSSSSEGKIHLKIKIIEKKALENVTVSPEQKVSDLRDALRVRKYEDLDSSIFGSDGQKLDENKSFTQNRVISDHVLKIGKEVHVSSNIDQSARAK